VAGDNLVHFSLFFPKKVLFVLNRRCYLPVPFGGEIPMAKSTDNQELLKRSSLYHEFLAEREEILRHKWIESEKAGIDVGFEEALTGWMLKHRSQWRKRRHAARQCV
jgi:hypothetical protein